MHEPEHISLPAKRVLNEILSAYKFISIKIPEKYKKEVEILLALLETGEINSIAELMKKDGSHLEIDLCDHRELLEESSSKETASIEEFVDYGNAEQTGLTPDQQQALAKLKAFTRSDENFFRLQGYAGTGKSYLMCEYIKWLNSQKISYVAACPTNKAAKSLRNLADEAGLDLEVKTVAQLLGQQPELNEETGKEEFISKGKSDNFEDYRVVIIDEFSMVNRENFEDITTEADNHSCQVVFVGDAAQLPPVKEKEPMAATSRLITSEAKLSKIVRYDGDIAHVAEAIRSNPTKSLYPFTTTADKTIVCLPKEQWLNQAIALFESQEYKLNPDYVRFLAWRNKTVEELNNFVRLHLWGEGANPYVPGDRLIARKPLFRPKPGGKGRNKWRIFINNSEEARVTQAGVLTELVFRKDVY